MNQNPDNGAARRFCCNPCKYYTDRNGQYLRHMTTAKHKLVAVGATNVSAIATTSVTSTTPTTPKCVGKYVCKCGSRYMHRSGLWKHQKVCGDNRPRVSAMLHDIKTLMSDQNKNIADICKTPKNYQQHKYHK